mgnify:CR=1 FL=1
MLYRSRVIGDECPMWQHLLGLLQVAPDDVQGVDQRRCAPRHQAVGLIEPGATHVGCCVPEYGAGGPG